MTTAIPAPPATRDWLWHPAAIVFLSNVCIMVIELVAGRIVAPHIGVSLYTWTTIIGVVLAGLSLGNWLGGKLADRHASRQLLGVLFFLAGLSTLSVLVTVNAFGTSGLFDLPGQPLILRMIAFISAIFFLPGFALGFISPMVIKLTLKNLGNAGSTIGRIYAASALGSIVGTFATGFYLISLFGTRSIILGCGLFLIAMGLLLGDWFKNRAPAMMASAVLLGLTPFVPRDGMMSTPCLHETDYFCIRVRTEDYQGTVYKQLLLDRLVHSYTAPDDPTKLRYGYEMASAEVLDHLVQRDGNISAYFIGAGGYTLPKYMEHRYGDKALIHVAEIDPMVTEMGYQHMGMARDSRIQSFSFDARLHLKNMPENQKYSVVFGDAFNDFSVPYHLTTQGFNENVRAHMTDNGIYVLNIIDGEDLPFLAAFLRTLKQTFAHVVLVPNGKWLSITRNTYVVLASPSPIDLDSLRKVEAGDKWANINDWLASEADMKGVMDGAIPLRKDNVRDGDWNENTPPLRLRSGDNTFLLTDDFVPTDTLLLPMFEASEAKK